jgi:hypothetical protein
MAVAIAQALSGPGGLAPRGMPDGAEGAQLACTVMLALVVSSEVASLTAATRK